MAERGVKSADDRPRLESPREENGGKFGTSLGMYVTMIGYSIGMSDFWRFAFLTYRNGGGAFLIPFIIFLLLCGVPLYFLEFNLAKFSGKGPYKIWDICPLFRGAGAAVCIAYTMFLCGNTIMRCWMFDFLYNAFQDPLPWANCDNDWNTLSCMKDINATHVTIVKELKSNKSSVTNVTGRHITGSSNTSEGIPMSAAEEFWQYHVLELSPDISRLYPVQWRHIIVLFVLRALVCLFVYRSVNSIVKVMYFTTTIPMLLIFAIFIRSLTLPGWQDGIYHFFYPDFSKLLNIRIWIEAALMVFYTLAFGWGAVVSMGSHAKFGEKGLRTAIIIPMMDGIFAIILGMVSFSVLGNIAYTYGVPVPEVLNADMTAGIVSYVTALVSFPLPQLWSVIFFTAVIVAGLDEQMIPIDMTVQVIGEMYPKLYPRYRTHVLVSLSVFLFLGALPTCTGAGAYIFLWVDWYSGAWIGPCVAALELIIVAWIYGLEQFSRDLTIMSGQPLSTLMRYMLAFVSPFIVLVLFVTSCVEYIPPQYGKYKYPFTARILGWCSVVIVLLPLVTHAIYSLCRSQGSFTQRLRKVVRKKVTWGACEPDLAEDNRTKGHMFKTPSFSDIFLYNVCGQKSAGDGNRMPNELEKLNSNNTSALLTKC